MKGFAAAALVLVCLLGACLPAPPREAPGTPAGMTKPPPTPRPEEKPSPTESVPPVEEMPRRVPPQKASWRIQYSGEIRYDLEADVYNLDLFDTPKAEIDRLHERGVFVMCYFSAGSYEDWRPDAAQFPPEVLGNAYEGWEGEIWLDIRAEALKPLIAARLDLAAEKGCDGVDPDNVNGFENESGFPLSYEDQLAFNIWLAKEARARGLSIGLKNDLPQIPDLLPYFDWALNESCFAYEECGLLNPFIAAGKPVFVIEYDLIPESFCPKAKELGFNAVYKNRELDEFAVPCE